MFPGILFSKRPAEAKDHNQLRYLGGLSSIAKLGFNLSEIFSYSLRAEGSNMPFSAEVVPTKDALVGASVPYLPLPPSPLILVTTTSDAGVGIGVPPSPVCLLKRETISTDLSCVDEVKRVDIQASVDRRSPRFFTFSNHHETLSENGRLKMGSLESFEHGIKR